MRSQVSDICQASGKSNDITLEIQLDQLKSNGFFYTHFHLESALEQLVRQEQFEEIDASFRKLCSVEGKLFNVLKQYASFTQIEFIISLRDSNNAWEEDGIWHDDGSRKLAFSLSLIDSKKLEGGVLEIRKKGEVNSQKIPPFNTGEMIVFQTGLNGYEHKINKVSKGKRLVIAGWCS